MSPENYQHLMKLLAESRDIMTKISIRFFNDREVRAAWDESSSQWFFAAVDIVAVLNKQSNQWSKTVWQMN